MPTAGPTGRKGLLDLLDKALSLAAARLSGAASPAPATRVWWAVAGAEIPLELVERIEAAELR